MTITATQLSLFAEPTPKQLPLLDEPAPPADEPEAEPKERKGRVRMRLIPLNAPERPRNWIKQGHNHGRS